MKVKDLRSWLEYKMSNGEELTPSSVLRWVNSYELITTNQEDISDYLSFAEEDELPEEKSIKVGDTVRISSPSLYFEVGDLVVVRSLDLEHDVVYVLKLPTSISATPTPPFPVWIDSVKLF